MQIKEVNDKPSDSVPTLEEMRLAQLAGGRGKGTNPPDAKLNECQGHEVDLQD